MKTITLEQLKRIAIARNSQIADYIEKTKKAGGNISKKCPENCKSWAMVSFDGLEPFYLPHSTLIKWASTFDKPEFMVDIELKRIVFLQGRSVCSFGFSAAIHHTHGGKKHEGKTSQPAIALVSTGDEWQVASGGADDEARAKEVAKVERERKRAEKAVALRIKERAALRELRHAAGKVAKAREITGMGYEKALDSAKQLRDARRLLGKSLVWPCVAQFECDGEAFDRLGYLRSKALEARRELAAFVPPIRLSSWEKRDAKEIGETPAQYAAARPWIAGKDSPRREALKASAKEAEYQLRAEMQRAWETWAKAMGFNSYELSQYGNFRLYRDELRPFTIARLALKNWQREKRPLAMAYLEAMQARKAFETKVVKLPVPSPAIPPIGGELTTDAPDRVSAPLLHHVTGAIERGEKEAIVCIPTPSLTLGGEEKQEKDEKPCSYYPKPADDGDCAECNQPLSAHLPAVEPSQAEKLREEIATMERQLLQKREALAMLLAEDPYTAAMRAHVASMVTPIGGKENAFALRAKLRQLRRDDKARCDAAGLGNSAQIGTYSTAELKQWLSKLSSPAWRELVSVGRSEWRTLEEAQAEAEKWKEARK